MSPDEKDATIGRLVREHREIVEKRLHATERVKQIAAALKRLADAIDRKPASTPTTEEKKKDKEPK